MPGPGSEVFVAGPYTCTLGGVDIGELDPQGDGRAFVIQHEIIGAPIRGHTYGESRIDGVYQGGNVRLTMICNEQNAAALQAYWPWGSGGLFVDMGEMGQVGRLYSGSGSAFVATAVTGTEAATIGPATLTATLIPEEGTREMVFGSTLRQFPARFIVLPQTAAPSTTFFTVT